MLFVNKNNKRPSKWVLKNTMVIVNKVDDVVIPPL
jgi:hypothetical protein